MQDFVNSVSLNRADECPLTGGVRQTCRNGRRDRKRTFLRPYTISVGDLLTTVAGLKLQVFHYGKQAAAVIGTVIRFTPRSTT